MSTSPVSPVNKRSTDFREPGSAPRWRISVGAALVAVLVLLGVGVALTAVSSARGSTAVAPVPSTSTHGQSRSSGPPSLFVHVLGRVARPGLYEVPAGSRAVDVVTAAGGFETEADQAALNLARPVADGEQIVIPALGEQIEAAASAGSPSAGGAPASLGASGGGPVDLNSADAKALEALSGVGPATATAILDWRAEHGRFESVDDLLDVKGIGAKKLEGIRDQVVAR